MFFFRSGIYRAPCFSVRVSLKKYRLLVLNETKEFVTEAL